MASERVMRGVCVLIVCAFAGALEAQTVADFEDLVLQEQSYWNGADGAGGFQSGGAWFKNNYDTQYGSWDGFAYSNIADTSASGWTAQFNAIAGSGQGGSDYYAIGYVGWAEPPTIILDEPATISGLYVTNNNYAYYSMLYGDMFAKKFGGAGGNDADWFLLTITGKDATGAVTGTKPFYLADYTFSDGSMDYIVNDWQFVNLASLGQVKTLEFTLSSSDTGSWGMNTPAYFAIDTILPEPGTFILLALGGAAASRRRPGCRRERRNKGCTK